MPKIDAKATKRGFLITGLAFLMGLVGAGFSAPTTAASDGDPGTFIQSLGQQAIALLADDTLAPIDRQHAFRELLTDRFDMTSIGRLVMGRHWRQMTEAQRKLFGPLFEDFVVTTYSRRLAAYSGETLKVGHTRNAGKSLIAVGSEVARARGQSVNVDWMLRRNKGRWYVIDVVIEGVSMVITQRSEFATVISQRGGVDGLIETLRVRIDVANADEPEAWLD
ncbi:MAG: ABC transporter substrate-binding protein [Pseudomonadota bacterium]